MRAFLLLFLLFPVLELYVFFKVSTAIGFFPALLLIIAGSMLGVLVVRVAGLASALRARESLSRGELPAQQMLEGLMLALGGGGLVPPSPGCMAMDKGTPNTFTNSGTYMPLSSMS